MQRAIWRMPARLLRRSLHDPAAMVGTRQEVAHGPLVEMVAIATEVGEEEGKLLSIDFAGTRTPLVWADIRALRNEPTFPIDI